MPKQSGFTLDQFQCAAVESTAVRLAIAAPAGSGKTRVLIERVARFVQRGACPERILVVTFARKAAHELRHRLAERGLQGVQVKTFHAWALELVRRSHVVAGRLLLEQEKFSLLWKLCIELNNTSVWSEQATAYCLQENWSRPFLFRQLIGIQERLMQCGVLWQDPKLAAHAERDPLARLTQSLMQQYQLMLERHGASDFALLIGSAVRQKSAFTPHYEHVLVDEVQDAAQQELQLLQTYCADVQTQTWVGDSCQSLYGWRGAAGVIPHASTQLALRHNYRSTANIISTVNYFLRAHIPSAHSIITSRPPAGPVEIISYPRYEEDRLCTRLLRELQSRGVAQQDVTILSRAHQPLDRLQKTHQYYPHVKRCTVHAYKGLEARVVIVVNAAQNRFGFPLAAKGESHRLLADLAAYDSAREERHIFYVALTRARERLIVCVPQGEPSPFTQTWPKKLARRVTLPNTYP